MAIVYDKESLDEYMRTAVDFSHDRPVLIDKFLEQAAEFDVDALADESACVIAGIQEHIEEAGIHSGDSSCVLPPVRIATEHLDTMRHYTRKLAAALSVKGLMNIQFAIKDDRVYVLEVNPRASRTVPFVSKATGVPLARIGALVMAGHQLKDFGLPEGLSVDERFYVKSGEIALVINTPLGRASHFDEQAIRRAALQYNVPCVTTMTGAQALVEALASRTDEKEVRVYALQDLHAVGASAR